MLRHTGEKRSFSHNIRLAVLLSSNAGFINAAGFIAFSVLTTNVTGHAALFAVHTVSGHWREARMVALWLSLFLAGAFISAWLITAIGKEKVLAYSVPILIIMVVMFGTALFGADYNHSLRQTELFAGSLLFSMGMQNAMVSMISGSMVRTTHLTGMVTDLGIDMSAAMHSRPGTKQKLQQRIKLRLVIIFSFLGGGLAGGFVFLQAAFRAFYIPVLLLLLALCYDYFRIRVRWAVREKVRAMQR